MKFNKNSGINWLRFAGILALCWVMQSNKVRSQPAPIANIPQLSELKLPATNASKLLSQAPIQITGVKINTTDKGLEVILQTSQSEQLQVVNQSSGNSFIVDIPNAQLSLTTGNTFSQNNPANGIASVTLTNQDANTIRVIVIGATTLPVVELSDSPNEGLIFEVASVASSVQPQPQSKTPPTSAENQPTSETQPSKPSAESDEPIELVVTGEQDGYRVPNASTATKTDTPLRDIPHSIQVIPRQLIEDRQATRIGDVLRNVSGIQQPTSGSRSGHFDIFFIRGFSSANEGVLRDGLRDRTNSRIGSPTINLERIEVLKGPVAALYGQGGLGGTINLVSKQPLSEPYYAISASAGNYDFYRGTLDFSGPLNPEKTLLYRLTAAAETSGSFIDFVNSEQYFISPVLTWLISKNTTLTLTTEYTAAPRKDEFGIPAIGTVAPNPNGRIPRNRFIGEPDDADNRYALRVGYNFEHRFSNNWQFRNAFRATFFTTSAPEVFPSSLASNNRDLQRTFSQPGEFSNTDDYNLDTYVTGKFATGSIAHQLLIGLDLFREVNRYDGSTRAIAPLDLFNPVYGSLPGAVISRTSNQQTQQALGIYIQDQIALADNLKLLLGGRLDILNQKQNNFLTTSKTFQQNEGFSPRVGIVYQPITPLSLYASYGRSITQVVGTTFDTTLFEPERGTQYEVGVKADLNDRVSAVLAFYDLTRANVSTPDLRDTRFSIQTGEQRSRGIEFDLSGEISPGWNIFASAAYTDTEITSDNFFRVGNSLANIPKFSASLWTTYEIQKGDWRGLGFGLGLYYVGDRQGDLANSFELPSYVRTDAAIYYKQGRLRTALNFKNLFDIEYFENAGSSARVNPGEPFTVVGTVGFEF
ncbi:MAG: TonB-dependent siderophore receptor [Nostoc sp.]|uniref:TonB-dependent siderophore receptor n=1 Tax=Nostoc sp. TaxID=1180 RepID=UPI002FFA12D1